MVDLPAPMTPVRTRRLRCGGTAVAVDVEGFGGQRIGLGGCHCLSLV